MNLDPSTVLVYATLCIFSQPLHLRAACIFSLVRTAFASLRRKRAYFRILPPYATNADKESATFTVYITRAVSGEGEGDLGRTL